MTLSPHTEHREQYVACTYCRGSGLDIRTVWQTPCPVCKGDGYWRADLAKNPDRIIVEVK